MDFLDEGVKDIIDTRHFLKMTEREKNHSRQQYHISTVRECMKYSVFLAMYVKWISCVAFVVLPSGA